MKLKLRGLEAGDAIEVAALSGHFGYPVTGADMESRMQLLFNSTVDWAWVAVHEQGRIVGWIQVTKMLRLERGVFLEITGLVVDEAWRSQGIGRKLVGQAIDFAKESGIERLVVRSNAVRSRAHRFYLNLGFANFKDQKVFDLEISHLESPLMDHNP